MLTKHDLRHSFSAFSFLSKAFSFPAYFDSSSGSFRIPSGGRRRRLLFQVVLLFFTVHALLVSGRTFAAGVISRNLPLEFIAFGIITSVSYLGICVLGFLAELNLETQVKVWRVILERLDEQGSSSGVGKKTWQELGVCYFPLLLYPAVLIFPVMYLIDPDLPFLLHGNVPQVMRCTPVLVSCCLCDVIILLFHINMSSYFTVYGMLFIRQMKKELSILKDKLERFGLHPESGNTGTANVTSPVGILKVRQRKTSDTGPGTTADVDDTFKRQEHNQRISEVQKWVNDSDRCNGEGQLKNMVKDQTDLDMIPVVEQQEGDTAGTSMSRTSQNVATVFQDESKQGGINLAKKIGRKLGVKTGDNWGLNTVRKMVAKGKKKYGNKVDRKWPISVEGRWGVIYQKKESVSPGPSWAVKNKNEISVVKSQDKHDFEQKGILVVQSQDKGHVGLERKGAIKSRGNRLEKTAKKLTVEAEMELEMLINDQVRSDIRTLNFACKALENIRLLSRLFNESFADSVFITMLVDITVTMWSAFAALRLAQTHPYLALCYGFIAVGVVLHFFGAYNDAFLLTGQVEKCKSMILIHSSLILKKGQICKEKWNEIRCRVAAIPKLYCAHFHVLERNSSLSLINFVLNKLADLLGAFS